MLGKFYRLKVPQIYTACTSEYTPGKFEIFQDALGLAIVACCVDCSSVVYVVK